MGKYDLKVEQLRKQLPPEQQTVRIVHLDENTTEEELQERENEILITIEYV